jgi:hypothetical protein
LTTADRRPAVSDAAPPHGGAGEPGKIGRPCPVVSNNIRATPTAT